MSALLSGRVGLALGSGAARGFSHIGVLRALQERGIRPQVVAGTSIGAAVAAAFAADRLDAFESWARQLDRRQVLSFLDVGLGGGGVIRAQRVLASFTAQVPDCAIESLQTPFGAVATDLETGREVWLRSGSLVAAVRASVAIPGLVTPLRHEGHWVVDGGLVNPVPISLCRALGADSVIAVDLNTTLLGRRFGAEDAGDTPPRPGPETAHTPRAEPGSLRASVNDLLAELRRRTAGEDPQPGDAPPSLYEVAVNSIGIMQVRITRSRMAGDPPELLVTPRLGDFALLDFDRASEAIEEGRRAVAKALSSG